MADPRNRRNAVTLPVTISGVLSMPRAAVSPVLLSALAEAFNGA